MLSLDSLRETVRRARRAVALTGAGISAASGLPTFSDSETGAELRRVLTISTFRRDPEGFYRSFREMLSLWEKAEPNAAHMALAEADIPVVTQNIDGLHQKAGSTHVIEIHGSVKRLVCEACGDILSSQLVAEQDLPKCSECGWLLKPDVVLFGEALHDWEEAVDEVSAADFLLVVGTSLEVAPANLLPEIAASQGAEVYVVNERAEEVLPVVLEVDSV